jgi:hypothetical protein
LSEQTAGALQEKLALFRQRNAFFLSHEELNPQLGLKVLDLTGEGRLGEAQFGRSSGKAERFGNSNKIA